MTEVLVLGSFHCFKTQQWEQQIAPPLQAFFDTPLEHFLWTALLSGA